MIKRGQSENRAIISRTLVMPAGNTLDDARRFPLVKTPRCWYNRILHRAEKVVTYLDYNATTPVFPEVLQEMLPFLQDQYANPSSPYQSGRSVRRAIEGARARVASAVGASPSEVIFTASGTESNNTIIKGVAFMSIAKTIAVGSTEHPCVLCAARSMQRHCFNFIPIAVDSRGHIISADLAESLNDCALISVMAANNETGVVADLAPIRQMTEERGVLLHSDATQALGKIPLDFNALDVDAMSLSSHKAYGPKGAAALIVKPDVRFAPLLEGGGQEHEMRSGTENVAAIVGFGLACELVAERAAEMNERTGNLRDLLEVRLRQMGAFIFAADAERLPNTCYFGFEHIDGNSLVTLLDEYGFSASSGAACSSMKGQASHVLLAMGVDETLAYSATRVSLGYHTSRQDIDAFCDTLGEVIKGLSDLSAIAPPAVGKSVDLLHRDPT